MKDYKLKDESVCKKLAEIGVHKIEDILFKDSLADLCERSKSSLEDITTIHTNVLRKLAKKPVKLSVLTEKSSIPHLIMKTGCVPIDILIPEGIPSGKLTQIFGHESSGKTQLCLNLTVEFVKFQHKVLYIDTQSAVSVKRLADLLENNKLDHSQLKFVDISKIFSIHELFDLLNLLLLEDKYSLVILDSLSALLNYTRVQMELQNQKKLFFQFLKEMNRMIVAVLQKHPNLGMVITNYPNQWYQKYCSPFSINIHLSISAREPFIYTARIGLKDQFPSQYQSCQFIITDSGLRSIHELKNKNKEQEIFKQTVQEPIQAIQQPIQEKASALSHGHPVIEDKVSTKLPALSFDHETTSNSEDWDLEWVTMSFTEFEDSKDQELHSYAETPLKTEQMCFSYDTQDPLMESMEAC